VLLLGITNGIYAIAAIGAMMSMVGEGRQNSEGMRMGLWGASQAISFGIGGLAGTAASDIACRLLSSPASAYAAVFVIEAALFLLSAHLAARLKQPLDVIHASPAQPANQGAGA
jgi:BCD family chlorophyll transporter-like MFS transporter